MEKINIDDTEIIKYLKFKNRMKFMKLFAIALILFIFYKTYTFAPNKYFCKLNKE